MNEKLGYAVLFGGGLVGALPALALWAQRQWVFGLIAFAAGFVGTLLICERLLPFKCPVCGRKLGRQNARGLAAGQQLRFVCEPCDTEWDTGLRVSDE